jgi:hypothetical protein
MGNTIVKNPRRIISQSGGDPSLPARVTTLENNEIIITYFESVSATTGTVTVPTGGTIMLDQFQGGVDAYVSTIANTKPTGIFPETSGGVVVDVSSFTSGGAWTLSGTPSAYPVAIIYVFKIKAKDYSNVTLTNVLELEEVDENASYALRLESQTGHNPADGLTYYFGRMSNAGATNSDGIRRVGIPKTGVIKAVVFSVRMGGVNGSNEDASIYIRKNSTTDQLLTSTYKFNFATGDRVDLYTGLSFAVSAGDYIEAKMVMPTFATNPTNIFYHMEVYIE